MGEPGGTHIFTVPFDQNGYHDDVRATPGRDGSPDHVKEPIYHYDPLTHDDTALVYTVFALEMLVKLREIGFMTSMYHLHSLVHGVYGQNAIVFKAVRTGK